MIKFSRYDLVLLISTIIWASTYLLSKIGTDFSPPIWLASFRCASCVIIFFIFFPKRIMSVRKIEIYSGFLIGISLAFQYITLYQALTLIPSSTASFISVTYIPLVILIDSILTKKHPSTRIIFSITLTTIGLLLIFSTKNMSIKFGFGELLAIISSLFIVLQIIFIGTFAKKIDPIRASPIQMFFATITCVFAALLLHEHPPHIGSGVVLFSSITGISSFIVLTGMNFAQKYVSATKSTLIYASEPIWAGIFGFIHGEIISLLSIIGMILILSSIAISRKS